MSSCKEYRAKPLLMNNRTRHINKEFPVAIEDFEIKLVFKESKSISTSLECLVNVQIKAIESTRELIAQINIDLLKDLSDFSDYCECNIKKLKDSWNKIFENNLAIWNDANGELKPFGYSKQKYSDIEQEVQNTTIQLMHEQSTCSTVALNNDCNTSLPDLTIPPFDGDYFKWSYFCDVYTHMVHDTSLPNSKKMIYLKNSLNGKAKALIQNMPISNDNYIMAWKMIEERYNNKRFVTDSLIRKLIYQPNIFRASAKELRAMYDLTMGCIIGLKGLNIGAETWDMMIICILSDKLDKSSYRLYEETIKEPRKIQKLDDFMAFLLKRFQTLESKELDRPREFNKPIFQHNYKW